MQRLYDAGLRVKLRKCELIKEKISYLCHDVTKDGVHMNESRVKAIANYPIPKSKDEIRYFIGLVYYFRSFVKIFAIIAYTF